MHTQEPEFPSEKPKPPSTWGTFVHKWGTYLSVDWVFNAAVGVTFAYATKFTDLGKRFWSGPITHRFEKALSPFIKDPAQRASSASYGNIFMSIIAGGMFTIPPLIVLESKNVKKWISKTIDTWVYGKEKVESDPKFEQAYDAIDDAPKKDFWAGMISRFAALSPLLAMVLIPKTKKISNKLLFDHVEHASGAIANKMGFSEQSFKTLSPEEAKGRWKFIHESVAMDAGLGIPYAILHAFSYNKCADWFANRKKKKEGIEAPIQETPRYSEPMPLAEIRTDHAARELAKQSAPASPTLSA